MAFFKYYTFLPSHLSYYTILLPLPICQEKKLIFIFSKYSQCISTNIIICEVSGFLVSILFFIYNQFVIYMNWLNEIRSCFFLIVYEITLHKVVGHITDDF